MLIQSSDFLSYLVFDEDGQKLGRVNDCTYNTDTFKIEQISVRTTSMLNPLTPELIINRKQIIRIEPGKVIVNSPKTKEPAFASLLKTLGNKPEASTSS